MLSGPVPEPSGDHRPFRGPTPMLSADQALARLIEGNRRFASSEPSLAAMQDEARRAAVAATQDPYAVILGCSDSRVPAEIVFHQGLGDLFVIRVAGNIVAPSQVGSVEFAVEQFGLRLVVVLGHSMCGAIKATVDALQRPRTVASRNIAAIVDRVRPSVEGLLETELRHDYAALVRQAGRANIRASVNQLRHGSAMLEECAVRDGLRIVGAEYHLETGVVEFL